MRSKKVMTVWSVLVGFFCILCRDVCVCVTCLPVMIKHAAIIRKLGCIFFLSRGHYFGSSVYLQRETALCCIHHRLAVVRIQI